MTSRSLTVDERLLRRMARDAAIYSLTRPLSIAMWVALAGALTLSILTLNTTVAAGRDAPFGAGWMPVLVIALAAYTVVMSISSARRAVHAAMPVGTTVSVSIGDGVLQVASGRGRSDIAYGTFQQLRVGPDAVLLKLRGAAVVTAIPRALLTDEDIAALRSRIA